MPWKEETLMSLRLDFVRLAELNGANMSQLCDRFGISRVTGYKWLERYQEQGLAGLHDRSRRPHASPNRTAASVEEAVLRVRDAHPRWGGRKIEARMRMDGLTDIPTPSTITEILKRSGRLNLKEPSKQQHFKSFEMERPNEMWQMDFKGHFSIECGLRCHPLTVLDDRSRFLLCLQACPNERRVTVQDHLGTTFRHYGLPEAMVMDNGPPWGSGSRKHFTRLTIWLIRLGIYVIYTGIRHPQTIGKDERLHRTLKAELLRDTPLRDLEDCQEHFDPWRHMYNFERPHEALDMGVPGSSYSPSPRSFPEFLPPILYPPEDIVRMVSKPGRISFQGRTFRVGRPLIGHPVALRPTEIDGEFNVFFCAQKVATISFRD